MPCRSDHMERSGREEECLRAACLLIYVLEKTGQKPEAWLVKEAQDYYPRNERSITELCATLKAMSPNDRDALIYNARDRDARHLADWWEEHQVADAKRERQESISKKREETKKQALAKLSREERKALGF